ncbi:MAG: exonuclease SbcCD subunit D [Clostridiales bacterium]|nr:exonuclease SbcCD subunit D [Clostridiales bacterium]
MKILHTADWHIGKLVHGIHMTNDQAFILENLIKLIEKEKVDVLLVAGDVYDRSVPPTEAVELLNNVLSEIIMKLKVKVIIIAGNHDSPDRLDFGSKILEDNGLHIIGKIKKTIAPIKIEDEYGIVNFFPIPYVEPAVVRAVYEDEECKNHDLSIKRIIKDIAINNDERNICLSHGFVMGTDALETSDSERPLSIGGSESVNVDYYQSFDYVALGHLHKAQRVKYDHIRYSSSLLKYSFSEADQNKSVSLIEIKEKGNINIEKKILLPLRDMRSIKGELKDLLNEEVYSLANREDYINAILTDQGELFEPMKKLRAVYPNILLLEREKNTNEQSMKYISLKELKNRNMNELFQEFYKLVVGKDASNVENELFNKAYEQIQENERKK